MRYLHTMVRVTDLDASLRFYCELLGLEEMKRTESEAGRFTLVFLAAPADRDRSDADRSPEVELTFNWDPDPQPYGGGRNFGHLAYKVGDIHAACQRLMDGGVVINRPPRDGRMAFVRSPDGISIELLQEGAALTPAEPWTSMPNTGSWCGRQCACHPRSPLRFVGDDKGSDPVAGARRHRVPERRDAGPELRRLSAFPAAVPVDRSCAGTAVNPCCQRPARPLEGRRDHFTAVGKDDG